jgi:hypothetical protein
VLSRTALGLGKGRAMDKAMCYGSLGVAILMFVIFLLDLFLGIPFGRNSEGHSPFILMDILGLISAGIVVYLAWNASKDLR